MFTGIIEEIGKVERVQPRGSGILLTISGPQSASELNIDDSISINGVCQTVIRKTNSSFEVEAVEETLKKTTFASLRSNDPVNLELPMKLNERLGGHLVLGHVDAVGHIAGIEPRHLSWMFTIEVPEDLLRYVVPVGSISVDGVSLTVAEIRRKNINVSIIPHTMENTIFRNYKIDTRVNLEFDIIGKYIEQMLSKGQAKEKNILSEQHLRELGY